MKFSLLTMVAPRSPSSRATYAPAKPPPTISTPPRASLVAIRCLSIGAVLQVSVIGSGVEREEHAEQVGRLLAERGVTVVTGGLGEVMAAAARGAKGAGGTTIGILPTERRDGASEWIDHVVATGIGHARNLAVVASGDAVIAVGGRYGTLAEIGFALTLGRPVVVLEPGWQVDGMLRATTPEEAVSLALAAAG